VDEYVRGAGIAALKDLMLEGAVPRNEIMAYFKELLGARLEREPFSGLRAHLICHATDLYPGEVQEEIRNAFRDELLDDSWIDEQEVQNALDEGMELCMKRTIESYKGLIEDASAELSSWLVRDDTDEDVLYDFDGYGDECEDEVPVSVLDELSDHRMGRHELSAPYRAVSNAGPNDPCPCGSGRKFKKCCGRTDINPPTRQP